MRVSPSKEQAEYLKFIGAFEAPAPSRALAPGAGRVRPAAGSTPTTFFTACCIWIIVTLALLLLGS